MNVKFVQAYHYVSQANFLGTNTFVRVPIGVVHISISETVLCGQNKHKILSAKKGRENFGNAIKTIQQYVSRVHKVVQGTQRFGLA